MKQSQKRVNKLKFLIEITKTEFHNIIMKCKRNLNVFNKLKYFKHVKYYREKDGYLS